MKCDVCQSERVFYASNAVLYGSEYGKWPMIYICEDCTAWVSCEPGTDTPRGPLVSQEVHQARKRAHAAFDPIWREKKLMARSDAYGWLAEQMGMTRKECHIGLMNDEQADRVVTISLNYLYSAKQAEPKRGKRK